MSLHDLDRIFSIIPPPQSRVQNANITGRQSINGSDFGCPQITYASWTHTGQASSTPTFGYLNPIAPR